MAVGTDFLLADLSALLLSGRERTNHNLPGDEDPIATGVAKKLRRKTMKKLSAILALFSIVLPVMPAYATNYGCTGTVTYLGVDSYDNGVIVVGGPGGLPPIGLCSLSQAGNFTMDACRAIYATLLTAKSSGQTIVIYFSDGLACSSQPAWGGAGSTSAWFVATQ